jgi:hypothetical protein
MVCKIQDCVGFLKGCWCLRRRGDTDKQIRKCNINLMKGELGLYQQFSYIVVMLAQNFPLFYSIVS